MQATTSGIGTAGGVGRIVVWLLALTGLVALATGCGEGPSGAPDDTSTSTLEARWVDADANGTLERGPGEPLVDRGEELDGRRTRTLASFAQITDAHVRDEESPARAPLFDRLDPRLNSTFRPQEALSGQVLDAAVQSVNAFDPDAVVLTGDLTDSAQRNELDQALAILGGGRVDPASGEPAYEGPQTADNPDPFFYRPDLDAPRHPGLLERAQEPFEAGGLNADWYAVAGNHDLLVQGEVPPNDQLEEIATGDRMLATLDPNLEPPEGEIELTPELVNAIVAGGLPGRTERVTPDPGRGYPGAESVVDRLRRSSSAGGSGPSLGYGFDLGDDARGIVLDLVDRAGGSDGLVGAEQIELVERELAAAGDRAVLVFSHQPIASSGGGEELIDLLAADDRVVAAIAGHRHSNSIELTETDAGSLWRVETAALTDFPQQARAFRLIETADGEVALETWMLDTTDSRDAGIARELAFLDAGGGRPRDAGGRPQDRNARLFADGP